MGEAIAETDFGWTIVHDRGALDPERYLGQFADLPLRGAKPGDWCEVVMQVSDGELRWTLAAVEGQSLCVTEASGAHPSELLEARTPGRRASVRPLREWEREDEAAAASSAPTFRRAAAGTDGKSFSRRRQLRLIQNIEAN